jgi:hypothetical protein
VQPPPLNAFPSDERRAHPRTLCSYKCQVASYKQGARLADLEFEPVRLNDISAGGFSFSTAQWPHHAELAFLLTDHPEAGIFLAHVRKVQHVKGYFIVRCQFIRRLDNTADAPVATRPTR